jgi:hypothetical protein
LQPYPRTRRAINKAVASQADSVKGKITEDKKVTLNGWPGKTARIQNADTTFLTAAYMAGNRLYQVIFVTLKGQTIAADVDEFLASFQITKSAPAK